jgi:hypothetical protein
MHVHILFSCIYLHAHTDLKSTAASIKLTVSCADAMNISLSIREASTFVPRVQVRTLLSPRSGGPGGSMAMAATILRGNGLLGLFRGTTPIGHVRDPVARVGCL